MLFELILVLVFIWLAGQRWQKQEMFHLSHTIGTIKHLRLPIVGHSYIFLGTGEDRMSVFQELGREAINNGGIITLWQGLRLYLMIADPVQAEFVLKNCLEKDDTMKCLRILTGNGSVFAPVPIWRPRRKILAPTFSPKNLNYFTKIFSKQSSIMVHKLRSIVGKGAFPIWKYINTYSMDSVCETTLGVQVRAQIYTEQPLLKAFEESTQLDSARLCQPWIHSEAVYKMTRAYGRHAKCRTVILNFIDQIINNKRNAMKEEKLSKAESEQNIKQDGLKTFLDLLIESSGDDRGYSNVELQEETLVLVLAGTDTSAVGSSFTTVLLSQYPEVQDRIYRELQEVFGDSDRAIVSEDLPRLKYLEAVIKESLRLYPPVPVIVRKVDKDVTLPSGVTLVNDCGIVVNIWGIHRNPKYWGEDAELFKPERFLDSNLLHPAAYMPFSYGPRACLGYRYAMMSMKTMLAALLRQYRVLPATAADSCELRLTFDVMMKDFNKFTVQLESRH